jgi:hypothetical protein
MLRARHQYRDALSSGDVVSRMQSTMTQAFETGVFVQPDLLRRTVEFVMRLYEIGAKCNTLVWLFESHISVRLFVTFRRVAISAD